MLIIPNARNVEREWKDRLKILKTVFGMTFIVVHTAVRSGSDALNAKTHDLIIADGDLIAIDNAERVAQQIKIQLLTWLGEWFLDITHGVPYLDYILVKNPNIELARSIFKEQIMKVDDVNDVTSLEIYYNATERTITV